MYNPSRCELCKEFFNDHFILQTDPVILAEGHNELCLHLRKLNRHVGKSGNSLGIPLFVQEVRKKSGNPVKVNYFENLSFPEEFHVTSPDTISVSSRRSSVSKASLESKVEKLEATTHSILSAFHEFAKEQKSINSKYEAVNELLSNTSAPNVIIRQVKGGDVASVVDGAGVSGTASTSAAVSSVPSSSAPPPPSVPPTCTSGTPPSGASSLPSGSGLGVGRGIKRSGDVVKGNPIAKARKVSSVVEFREGKEYAVSGEGGSLSVKGSLLKGSYSVMQDDSGNVGVSMNYQEEIHSGLQLDSSILEESDNRDKQEEEEREEGEIVEDEVRPPEEDTFEVPGFSLDHAALEGSEYGHWGMLKPPFSLLLHNGKNKAIYNSVTGTQIPIDSVMLATLEGGSKMFCVKRKRTLFKVRKAAEVFATKGDKSRASQFFAMFQSLFPKGDKEMAKGWMQSFDSSVRVPSGILSEADFPFSFEDAVKLFQDTAAGVKSSHPSLPASVIPYIPEYSDIVACLPMPKFPATVLATEFGVASTSVFSLNKDLLQAEYTRRMCLLTVLSLFSSRLALYILPGEINTLSAFEASIRNNLGGYSGMLAHLANVMLKDFAEARVELRKSAFRNPDDTFPMRMIRASPFSKTLFCGAEKTAIGLEFGRFNKTVSWEKMLKTKPSSDKATVPKAGPSQPKAPAQPRFKPYFSPRGRGKGGPFKSSRGGGQHQGQKFRSGNNNQRSSRGRGGQRN